MKIKQLNVDCYDCEADLNSPIILDVLETAAQACGAKVIGRAFQEYPEYGITAVIFLAESHILISTYPEIKFAVVEIFLCDDKMDTNTCWNEINKYIKPRSVKTHEFYHLIDKDHSDQI